MPIISFRDNENSKRKRNAKKHQKNKQRQKAASGTETIVKGWELNDFAGYLS